MNCVSCHTAEATTQQLCRSCLRVFKQYLRTPAELISAHWALHIVVDDADAGRLHIEPAELELLRQVLTTVCWVIGCTNGKSIHIRVTSLIRKILAEGTFILSEVVQ